jgi:hypothetical protein
MQSVRRESYWDKERLKIRSFSLIRFMMLCGVLSVQQAAIGDCLSFDPFSFDQNGLAPAVNVGSQVRSWARSQFRGAR